MYVQTQRQTQTIKQKQITSIRNIQKIRMHERIIENIEKFLITHKKIDKKHKNNTNKKAGKKWWF